MIASAIWDSHWHIWAPGRERLEFMETATGHDEPLMDGRARAGKSPAPRSPGHSGKGGKASERGAKGGSRKPTNWKPQGQPNRSGRKAGGGPPTGNRQQHLPNGGGLPPSAQAQVRGAPPGRAGSPPRDEDGGSGDEGNGTGWFKGANGGASQRSVASSMASSCRSSYRSEQTRYGSPPLNTTQSNTQANAQANIMAARGRPAEAPQTPGGARPRSASAGGNATTTASNGVRPRETRRRPGQLDPMAIIETSTTPNVPSLSKSLTASPTGEKTQGAVRFADGSLYTGELVDGVQHGKGTYKSAVGTFYDGEWVRGKRHGAGTERYPIGNTYEGTWQEDLKHGHGHVRAGPPHDAPALALWPAGPLPHPLSTRARARSPQLLAPVAMTAGSLHGAFPLTRVGPFLRVLLCTVQVRER